MQDTVSIVVPVYNVEEWLDECVESLVNQTYRNLEIILVDDGSTDNSGNLCEKWKAKDSRIKTVHKENGGLSSARNAGLDIINGEYVTFVDSDDYLEKESIETMLEEIKEYGVDIVRCGMNQIVDGVVKDKRDMNYEKKYNKNELLTGYYYYNDGMCGSVCDKLFKSHFFKKLRFPVGLNSEDYYVLFHIYLYSKGMYYDNRCLYNYRRRENSICTTNEITEHSFDRIKISDIIYDSTKSIIPKYIEDAEVFQLLSRFFTYSEVLCIDSKNNNKNSWIKELRLGKNRIITNKRINKKSKIQYLIFSYMTNVYIKLLKRKMDIR